MNSLQLTKSSMINFACDSLGHSEDDFDGLSFEEIKNTFTRSELQDVISYHIGY